MGRHEGFGEIRLPADVTPCFTEAERSAVRARLPGMLDLLRVAMGNPALRFGREAAVRAFGALSAAAWAARETAQRAGVEDRVPALLAAGGWGSAR